MIDHLYYGVCFFPEHWSRRVYSDDLKRIADCGMNFVRIGEGAWWYFEPNEGEYRFDLFDDVIELCEQNKLQVVFGTPTYTGPAWIGHKYPEVYRWNYNRIPMKHGSRRNYNYTAPAYLDLSDKIVSALAEHYKRAKPVFAWQVDNEFNCHMDVSYAPTDTLAFRNWLRTKYRTLDNLNAAWGTKFWSQVYSDWDQIDLPHPTATYHNPTQLLDETRFISDTVVIYCERQVNILTKANARWSITHNALFGNIDGVKLTEQLDFFSHDQYPLFYGSWAHAAQSLLQARSLSYPFAVLEQQSGPGGQMDYLHRTPRPGEIRLFAHQSLAHGTKMLSYFCWRTCPFGTEQHWHGLLDYDGRDNRRIDEAEQVGRDMKALPTDYWDAPQERVAAVLRDFDNETNDRRINTYVKNGGWEAGAWINTLLESHVPVDSVWPSSDWAGYRVLIAPHLKIIDQNMVTLYEQFASRGNVLVLGAQSGTKNRNLHMVQQTPPALLRRLTGLEVAEWSNMPSGETRTIAFDDGATLQGGGFVEALRLRGAEALARWQTEDDLLSDAPAIAIHAVGRGKVIYVGAYLQAPAVQALLPRILELAGVGPLIDAGREVEVTARRSKRWRYLHLLNHSAEPQFVDGLPEGRDLLSQREVEDGKLKLKPRDVAVIQTKL